VSSLRTYIDATVGDLRGRTLLIVLGCTICQMGLGFGYVFGPLAKDIIDEMGWSRGDFAFTRFLQVGTMALCSPLIGTLVVRHGARSILALSIGLAGFVLAALSYTPSLGAYYALMILMGVALTGVGDLSVGQLVSEWIERGRGLALGLVYIGSNLGGLIMIPFAVKLTTEHDWRRAMLGLSAIALFAMLPAALLLVRDNPRRHGAPTDNAVDRAEETADTSPPIEERDAFDLWRALRTRSFWLLAFSLTTFFFYFLALLEHLVLFLTDAGMSQSNAVTAYMTAVGLGIWSKLGLGLLADRIQRKTALLVVFALLATSSLTLLALPNASLLWLFVVTFGIAYAARDVAYPLIVTHCFGLTNMGQIYGALMIALLLGAAGPYFAGALFDHFGDYTLAFRVFAALNVASLLGLCFVRDERAAATSLSRLPQPR
jgi:sugar phosphate permease